MKNNKWYVISTFVLGCIVINFAGRILSDRLQLPLWLDSFGTVTAAYVLGPFCAAMVGMTVNLTYGIYIPGQICFTQWSVPWSA